MKNLLLIVCALVAYNSASAQFTAKVQMKEPLEGICDNDNVYVVLPGLTAGLTEATTTVSDDEILKLLNAIPFLKDNPKYKGSGMIGFYVSCEGKLLGCKMDNETGNAELDAQIEAVFKTLTNWKAAAMNGKDVDSHLLYSFEIKKGKFKF